MIMGLLRGIPKVRGTVIALQSRCFRAHHSAWCRGPLRVYGWPLVVVERGGRLALGIGVRMVSDDRFNELGFGGRCSIRVGGSAVCEIGDGVGMSGTRINARSMVMIGEGTMLGAGVTIMDSDLHALPISDCLSVVKCAPVVIGRRVFVGAGAFVLKGVTIGDGAIIGAGAVVTRSIPAGAVAAGNPAIVVRMAE